MIGIGGISMSALALLVHDFKIPVRGCDDSENSLTEKLRANAIHVSIGRGETITEDTVVYTGAVIDEHPQLRAARQAGKRLLPRAEFLSLIAKEYPHVISIAGCHGKTTTTAMLSHVFLQNRKATCHIGGEDIEYSNYFSTGNEYFITEACEFQRSFLSLYSETAVILNTDYDHSDCYRTKSELIDAYRQFARQSKHVIVNADDSNARCIPHSISFGRYNGEIRASELSCDGARYSFVITEHDMPLVKIQLNVIGKMSVYHALATFSVARLYGITAEEIGAGLKTFYGVKRRFETIGCFHDVPVIADYAHHPREIAAAIRTAKRICNGRVQVVFQPHTYTRTRDFMNGFVSVLSSIERPIIYETYAAREAFMAEGSAYKLVSNLKNAVYVRTSEQLCKRLSEVTRQNDLILILGAGNIYDIVKESIKNPLDG